MLKQQRFLKMLNNNNKKKSLMERVLCLCNRQKRAILPSKISDEIIWCDSLMDVLSSKGTRSTAAKTRYNTEDKIDIIPSTA